MSLPDGPIPFDTHYKLQEYIGELLLTLKYWTESELETTRPHPAIRGSILASYS